jgi:hypothetical protein
LFMVRWGKSNAVLKRCKQKLCVTSATESMLIISDREWTSMNADERRIFWKNSFRLDSKSGREVGSHQESHGTAKRGKNWQKWRHALVPRNPRKQGVSCGFRQRVYLTGGQEVASSNLVVPTF